MELNKETLLVRGGTRKGQKLARAESVPLWVTKNQECFCYFLTFSSEKQPQQSRMGAVDRTWGTDEDGENLYPEFIFQTIAIHRNLGDCEDSSASKEDLSLIPRALASQFISHCCDKIILTKAIEWRKALFGSQFRLHLSLSSRTQSVTLHPQTGAENNELMCTGLCSAHFLQCPSLQDPGLENDASHRCSLPT